MKKKVVLTFLIVAFLHRMAESQSCNTPTVTNNQVYSSCLTCNSLDDYLPSASDSIIYVRLNFHYLMINSTTKGTFKNATLSDANATVWGLNGLFDSLYTAQLRIHPSPAYIKRPKIQFVCNAFSKTYDSLAYFSAGVGNWSPLSAYTGDPNAIDIIYKGSSDNVGYGEASGLPGKAVKFNGSSNPLDTSYVWWNYTNILAHELGHCFGLTHTNYLGDACVNDYYIEGPGVWNYGTPPCDPSLDSTSSNNILGYHWACNRYLSPRQIARAHYNFRNTFLFQTLTPASQHYVRYVHSNFDVNITSNQTWSVERFIKGNVFVKQGNTLTILCKVNLLKNAKILVERGAKLVINGGEVTNSFGNAWSGIEISGTSTQNQNLSGGYALYQGYVNIINGGTLSNADVAINTFTVDSSGNLDWGSTGGIIVANTANFINNRKDVQYLYYHNPTGGNLGSFTRCNFKTNAALPENAVPDSRVSLYEVAGVNFWGNSFEYNAGNAYSFSNRGSGIVSVDASYTIDQICNNLTNPCNSFTKNQFKNFTHGVYVNNTNPLRVVTIKNTNFYDVLNYSTYFNAMNTPVFENNYVSTAGVGTGVGLYLNNCKYYNVKNNTFLQSSAVNNTGWDVGVAINNSTSGLHKIYRNSFANFNMAINAMNDNSGATNTTDGLLMNCNDFSPQKNNYDIALTGTSPTVMKNQGTSTSATTLVRNIYAATCTNENKWYIIGTSSKSYNHVNNSDLFTRPDQPSSICKDDSVKVFTTTLALNYATHCPASETSGGGGGGGGSARVYNADNSLSLQARMIDKLNYFLTINDPSGKDSVIELLKTNAGELKNAQEQLTYAYINKGDFERALQNARSLAETNPDLARLQQILISCYTGVKHLGEIKNNTDIAFLKSYSQKGGDEIGSVLSLLKHGADIDYTPPMHLPENSESISALGIAKQGSQSEAFSVYPNPTFSNVTFIYKNANKVQLKLIDVTGKVVYSETVKGPGKFIIPMTTLDAGVYLLNVSDGETTVYQTKIVRASN